MPAVSAKRALGASYAVTIVIRWCCCFSAVKSVNDSFMMTDEPR
jgi:hypothetical protein